MNISEKFFTNRSYWLIDLMPRRVASDFKESYAYLEKCYKNSSYLRKKQVNFFIKLSCYYKLIFVFNSGKVLQGFELKQLFKIIGNEEINVLIEKALLIKLDPQDIYMTLYSTDKVKLELIEQIAGSEGLFLWKCCSE